MAHVKTYLLAPNFDFRPGGKIVLGNIIADPFAPHRVLSAPAIPPTDEQVLETTQHDYRTQREAEGGVDMSIWAQLLYSIGLRLNSGYSMDTTVEYKMESLKTIQYRTEPTLEDVMTRVVEKRVENIMQPNKYRSSPVYMVIAVKVAEKLSVSTRKEGREGGSTDGSIPLSETVTTGASFSVSRKNEHEESFRLEDDVAFAYQLMEIGFKGWREKSVVLDEYQNRAAFLSDGKVDGEETKKDVELRIADATALLEQWPRTSSHQKIEMIDERDSFVFVTSSI